MKKVRIGVIGVGTIADSAHLPEYARHPQVELTAIGDTNLERAKYIGEKYNIPNVYESGEDLIKSGTVDAISICTYNVSHVPLAKLAVENGIDVLVEKPLGISYAETKELADLISKHDRIGMVGMTHRFRNDARVIKRFVDNGDLGEIYHVRAQILRRRGTPTGWFVDNSCSGGGPLMDIGVHVLDLAWWLAGQPEAELVVGKLATGLGNYQTELIGRWQSSSPHNQDLEIFDVEDFASAFISFANGMSLSLEVSWALNGPQDDALKVDLFGTEAGISLDPLRFYLERHNILLESQLAFDQNNWFADEIDHFITSVQNRTEPIPTIEQGARVVQMLEAIMQSSKNGGKQIVLKG